MEYQKMNAETIDRWVEEGWEWGRPISSEIFRKAREGVWNVVLTPTKPVPHEWFGDLKGKKVLGLASGGGQQIPVFSALGACCTVLDYSDRQLESEKMVAEREGYEVELIKADMTKPFPFPAEAFDLIFHPVSNCYIEQPEPVFRECFRVLKRGGIFLAGLDNGINYIVDSAEREIVNRLPVNPLKDPEQLDRMLKAGDGVQFSHTFQEQVGGQLKAGFRLTDLYEDTNGEGRLKELNIPCFLATRAVKE